MNKKSIFKAKAYKEPKVKTTKVKKPKTKSFTAQAQVIEIEDPQKEINKQVAEMKQQKEEAALLEAELEKPFEDRNKTLMRKYGYVDGVNKIDAYPDISGDQKYRIKVFLPEEAGIQKTLRPKPWYIKVEVKYEGNEFTYRFPVSRSSALEDETTYKLDNLPVWVDQMGQIVEEISEYTIYQALYEYSHKIKDNILDVHRIFLEYGIGKPGSRDLDFRIRNRGYGVTFTKNKETAASKKSTPKKTPGAVDGAQFADFVADEEKTVWVGNETLANAVIKRVQVSPEYRYFKGLDHEITFGDGELIVDHVVTGKTMNADVFYCMLTSWDKKTDTFGFAIINGVFALANVLPEVKRSRASIEEYIAKTNQRIYKEAQVGEKSVPDLLN